LKSVQAGIVKIKPTTTSVQHDIPPLKQLRPLEENVPRNTLLLRFGRAVLDAAPEPEAGHGDLAAMAASMPPSSLSRAGSAHKVHLPSFCQTMW
jgi:hypothetical protein